MTYIQEYLIHMTNGDTIVVAEPYELKGPDTLIAKYKKAQPETMFCVGDAYTGFSYFPVRNIVYISTGRVRKLDKGTCDHEKRVKAYGD